MFSQAYMFLFTSKSSNELVAWNLGPEYFLNFLQCPQAMSGFYSKYNLVHPFFRGTAVAQCLRCCSTNRKIAGSIPAGVTGIFR